jgi:hypothetical protein
MPSGWAVTTGSTSLPFSPSTQPRRSPVVSATVNTPSSGSSRTTSRATTLHARWEAHSRTRAYAVLTFRTPWHRVAVAPEVLPRIDEYTVNVAARPDAADPLSRLLLRGRHRFSEYKLDFRIDETDGSTRCRAETRARFPGRSGRLYRLAVIGTKSHRLLVHRMLRDIRRAAERTPS